MELIQGEYLTKFKDHNGSSYGLRLGVPEDALNINKAYVEIFGHEYTDAIVYDVKKLAADISKKIHFGL